MGKLTTARGASTRIMTVGGMADFLQQNVRQIALAAAKGTDPAQMIRLARTMLNTNPDLLECTPISILGGVIQAAQLGLELDGFTGAAYLVPFNNTELGQKEAQFMPGYRGLMRLARRSGEVTNIVARVVRLNDVFEIELGTHDAIKHVPSDEPFDDNPEKSLKAVYAYGLIKDAPVPQFDYMFKWQVDRVRAGAPGKNSPAWKKHYEAMAMKTVVRRLCKFLPISVEAQKAVTLDEMAEAGLGQNLAALVENPAAIPEGEPRKLNGKSAPSETTIAAAFHTALLEKLGMAEEAQAEVGEMIATVQRLSAKWQADHANDADAIEAINAVAGKELAKLGAND